MGRNDPLMPLRIGFDMDGVLADLTSAYREVEGRLFGPAASPRAALEPDDVVWDAIRATRDFWTTLEPTDPGAVKRIHEMALRYGWEVFFITQRPATEGETVQRQTQKWLVQQGFDLPSVLVIQGSRGAAAAALRLDYHVDDSPTNCVDVKTESGARAILVVVGGDKTALVSARRLGVGTARTIGECLDILEQATAAHAQPKLFERIAALVGWR